MPRLEDGTEVEVLDFAALFADDLPPRHDLVFETAVMRKVARRRLILDLAWGGLVAGVSALLLWALGPVLVPVLKPLGQTLLIFAPMIAVTFTAAFLIHPRTALI